MLVLSLGNGSGSLFASEAYKDYYYINTQNPGSIKDVVLAYDPKGEEFVWKDFGADKPEWLAVATEDLDPILRDVKSKEEVEKIVTYDGISTRLRHIGDDVGVAIDYKLKGGGPITAAICGAVCAVINTAGCIAGGAIVSPMGPIVVAMYIAVCAKMDAVGAVGCAAMCLGTPTP